MLIKEYRIPMPMSVEEYRIAQLYMIQVSPHASDTLQPHRTKKTTTRPGFRWTNLTIPLNSLKDLTASDNSSHRMWELMS